MRQVVVDISDLKVVTETGVSLVTYALGSCIALVAWDPRRKVGGMIHYMLPASSVSPDKARARPAMFADTGVPLLLERLAQLGCRKSGLVLKAAGGAARWNDGGTFDIGRRNYVALRKLLWRAGLLLAAEEVGGTRTRTVRLDVGTGRVTIRSEGEEWEL